MIQAIPTWYDGHKFRSRLEARWAVFFNHLRIRYEYEAEGYTTTQRLTLGDETPWYLPDFWLPDLEVFAEVKGSLPSEECIALLDVVTSLSCNGGAGCHDDGGYDTVLLGPIQDLDYYVPLRLHMHKGDLQAAPFNFIDPWGGCPNGELVARDVGGIGIFEDSCIVRRGRFLAKLGILPRPRLQGFAGEAEIAGYTLLRGGSFDDPNIGRYRSALRAARSARFEHGESGEVL